MIGNILKPLNTKKSSTSQIIKVYEEWGSKTWTGLTSFSGQQIWTDNENIYYSNGSDQYVLDKSNSTWSVKTWIGLSSMYGAQIWKEGENIYYSYLQTQYEFNKKYKDKLLLGQNGEFSPIDATGIILPTAPSSDGTYILQCVISNGTPTYSWVTQGA